MFICALPSCCDIGPLCFKDNIIDTGIPYHSSKPFLSCIYNSLKINTFESLHYAFHNVISCPLVRVFSS